MSELSPKWFVNIEHKTGFNLALQIGKAVLLAWIPAQVIWLSIRQIYPGPSDDMIFLKTPLRAFTVLILLAPMLETYMMRFTYFCLGKFIKTETTLNITSAIAWGILHLNSESWGLHAVWAFFVMGICFLRLRQKSAQHALYVTMIIHALFNALSYGLYLSFE